MDVGDGENLVIIFIENIYIMKKILLIILCGVLLTSCSTTQTFYIVRHTEKAEDVNQDGDPLLSQVGRDRAVVLERYMARKKIDSVFTSKKKRTILTGLTVALPGSIYQEAIDQDNKMPEFIARLNKISTKKNILIVSHSDKIRTIILGLGILEDIGNIPENEYDNLYIVTKKTNEMPTLVKTKY